MLKRELISAAAPRSDTARFVAVDVDMASDSLVDADVAPGCVTAPRFEIMRFVATDADEASDSTSDVNVASGCVATPRGEIVRFLLFVKANADVAFDSASDDDVAPGCVSTPKDEIARFLLFAATDAAIASKFVAAPRGQTEKFITINANVTPAVSRHQRVKSRDCHMCSDTSSATSAFVKDSDAILASSIINLIVSPCCDKFWCHVSICRDTCGNLAVSPLGVATHWYLL